MNNTIKVYNEEEMNIITFKNMLRVASRQVGIINLLQDSYKCYYRNHSNDKVHFGNTINIFRYNSALFNKVNLESINTNLLFYNEDVYSAGCSIDKTEGMIKAIGESIERLCLLNTDKNINLLYASTNDLLSKKIPHVDPIRLTSLGKKEYRIIFEAEKGNLSYTRNAKMYWTKCNDLITKAEYYIPTQKVWLDYSTPLKENIIDIPISTGAACGSFPGQAIISGIYEAIERDSFMLTWLFKIPSKEIVIDKVTNQKLRKTIDYIKAGITGEDKMSFYSISRIDGIYTVLGLIQNKKGGCPSVIVSAASNLNPEKAMLSALNELMVCYNFAFTNYSRDKLKEYRKLNRNNIISLNDHVTYYYNSDKVKNLSFLDEMETIRLSEMKNNSTGNTSSDILKVGKILDDLNMSIYFKDITLQDIKEAGFVVYKIIIPDLVGLEVCSALKHRYGKRIDEYINKYGKIKNDEPHPFP